jgi:hypothetical protein
MKNGPTAAKLPGPNTALSKPHLFILHSLASQLRRQSRAHQIAPNSVAAAAATAQLPPVLLASRPLRSRIPHPARDAARLQLMAKLRSPHCARSQRRSPVVRAAGGAPRAVLSPGPPPSPGSCSRRRRSSGDERFPLLLARRRGRFAPCERLDD